MTTVLIHPYLGPALGLRHGPRRHPRHAPAGVEEPLGEGALPALEHRASARGRGVSPRSRQGVPRATTSRSMCARTSATPAPTRRSAVPFAGRPGAISPKCRAPSRRRTRRSSASSTRQGTGRRAVEVEAVGGGAIREEPTTRGEALRAAPPARTRTRFFSGGAWHEAAVFIARRLAPGAQGRGPALVIEPHQTIVVEPGWQAEITAKDHVVLTRAARARARQRRRHRGRPGDARGVQQPLHVDRRADGRDAAEHRLFGEHQGAARLLLRGLRPQRRARRQRAAHAGASRLDGPLGRDDHPRERRRHPPGDVFALNAPYNGGTHLPDITVCTPVFDEAGKRSCSGSPRAATMPMSAAPRPAR
jgi:hypothetical protein